MIMMMMMMMMKMKMMMKMMKGCDGYDGRGLVKVGYSRVNQSIISAQAQD